ncbi:30S ribosomal protein S2 [Rickettsiella endosymbiont of Litargus connexus]|uniref:30S ribosomal protein S2 n=1 Tax=Rickettsiella endosymbiont of Litargus connexus TaxID=3066237 RepID=UPI00376F00AD|nr:30S ribosomal protein S2 [Candidatus Rickettsiella isopodorum]MDD5162216.1 30S ribosomal protein S2 [Candidatus Rickettsiella isopodorum]
MNTVSATLRQLFEAGVHFGHRTCFREPKMAPYIYGVRNGISIIDLEKTREYITEALNYIAKIAARPGSKILFVGTKRAAQDLVKEQALHCSMPYVNHRWLGGLLTNYRTIRQSIKRLKELETQSQDGSFNQLTKKEALNLQRQLDKLERGLGGIKDMSGLPDALFVIDRGYEHIAICEAQKLKIPVISIVDTNHSPEGIDYIIPGNDDAARAITLYTQMVADTILEARASAKKPTDLTPLSEVEKVEVQESVVKSTKSTDGKE